MTSTILKTVPGPSLAFRENLAQLISPLRRVRPRVPFYELAIHRIPTLSLYRNLLRYSPDENIRARVQYLFRKNRHATGTEKTRKQLLKGYKWLDAFKSAHEGDERQAEILRRYSRLLDVRVEKEHWKRLVRAEVAWQERLRSRPILTGAIVKPTLYNPPLPRMKRQPHAITRTIAARMEARERRFARFDELYEEMKDMKLEIEFEEHAVQLVGEEGFERVYSGEAASEWLRPFEDARKDISALLDRDVARSQMPISPELREMARAARREKIANKTRERERERRGEILPRTLERARQGPPAHVLVHMTPEERHRDKVVRGVGEVGYVGMVKRRMGIKLRDGGKGLARENGTGLEGEQLESLKKMEKEYWLEGQRRIRRNERTQ
ncbi:hypothetical protein C8R43DRAFT_979553 [Mycena crocata]|nr:hypothetical protein C8R43DRAFT_979553 [Mycena crocata]